MSRTNYERLVTELPKIARVVKQFPEALHEHVFNLLAAELRGQETGLPVTPFGAVGTPGSNSTTHVSLEDLKVKATVKSEAEWLLLFANEITGGGQKTYTPEDLKKMYEKQGRYQSFNRNNYKPNADSLTKKGWVKQTAPNQKTITDMGLAQVTKILKRTGSVKKSVRAKKSAKKGPTQKVAPKTKKK